MINWLRTSTTPEVAKYVDRYWFLEKQPGSRSYQYPKLNPDPTGHLIIAPPGNLTITSWIPHQQKEKVATGFTPTLKPSDLIIRSRFFYSWH